MNRNAQHEPIPAGSWWRTLAAVLAIVAVVAACDSVLPDVTSPSIEVSDFADGDTVEDEELTVTVQASDDRALASVRYATDDGANGTCVATSGEAYVCGPIPLALGSTAITFTARDEAGNEESVTITIERELPPGASDFHIEIMYFDEQFSPSQKQAFERAADTWRSIIVGDLDDQFVELEANEVCAGEHPAISQTVDDLLIFATSFTDKVGGVLGVAGPCLSRPPGPDEGMNLVGYMEFDTEDLEDLEADGNLVETIVHEMGHVLGIGTNWEFGHYDLLDYVASDGGECATAPSFTSPPHYTGASGVDAWHELGGSGAVPVEEEYGPGTRCGHWDEETFGNELMTGFLASGASNPLSALTVRSLEDLDFTVDASAAEPYTVPSGPALRTQAGTDLGAGEILLRPRGTVDPETGRFVPYDTPPF